jgi:hypothetical protein
MAMSKLLIVFLFILVACNNESADTPVSAEASRDTVQKKLHTWPANEENDFMAGCVDNAKGKLGDTASYRYCKCILEQVKETYPSLDSASFVLLDSTKVVAYAQNCK